MSQNRGINFSDTVHELIKRNESFKNRNLNVDKTNDGTTLQKMKRYEVFNKRRYGTTRGGRIKHRKTNKINKKRSKSYYGKKQTISKDRSRKTNHRKSSRRRRSRR